MPFLLQIFGKTQLVILMLLPSLNIPCKLSPIVQQSPPTDPPNDGLVGDFLPESDLPLQMFEIRIPCIRILWSTIQPLWRICKELPSKRNGCNCSCCSCCYRWCNFSPPSRCHRWVAASHKVYVLNGATFSQVRVDCATAMTTNKDWWNKQTESKNFSWRIRRCLRNGTRIANCEQLQKTRSKSKVQGHRSPHLQIRCKVDEKWDDGWKKLYGKWKMERKVYTIEFIYLI